MKLTLCVDEDRKVVIPAEAIERLHLEPGATVKVEVDPARPYVFDQEKFDAAMAMVDAMRPAFRAQMIADGYNTVDEDMEEIRPRW